MIAERPPNDLAALLAMFPSVPPVVRKRAKELMDEIRAAKQTIASGPDNDAMEVEQPEPPTSEEKAETSAQSSITRKFYSTPLCLTYGEKTQHHLHTYHFSVQRLP